MVFTAYKVEQPFIYSPAGQNSAQLVSDFCTTAMRFSSRRRGSMCSLYHFSACGEDLSSMGLCNILQLVQFCFVVNWKVISLDCFPSNAVVFLYNRI